LTKYSAARRKKKILQYTQCFKIRNNQGRVVALDPGIRTFLTFFW